MFLDLPVIHSATVVYQRNLVIIVWCRCSAHHKGLASKILIIEYSPAVVQADPGDPCNPSPCGPNSQCRVSNGQAVCSCLPEYTGSPPGCRPECVVSAECPANKACINQKCVNPCPSPCGLNTNCEVLNHSPICACKQGFTGDPFTRCFPVPRKLLHKIKHTICCLLQIHF